MRYSSLSTEFLESIGWHDGRAIDLEIIKAAYPPDCKYLHKAVIEYLQEFGMLSLASCQTPEKYRATRRFSEEVFDFTTVWEKFGGDERMEYLCSYTGRNLCPIGVGYCVEGGVYISDYSEIISVDDLWLGWGTFGYYSNWIEFLAGNISILSTVHPFNEEPPDCCFE